MDESIISSSPSSRTACSTAASLFDNSNKYYHQHQLGSASCDSEDVNSGWTTYFLMASAVASSSRNNNSSSNDTDEKQQVIIKVKGEPPMMPKKKKKKKKKDEEDALEDTASSPPICLLPTPSIAAAQDVLNSMPAGCTKIRAAATVATD